MSWSKPEWNTPMGSQPARVPVTKKRSPRLVLALLWFIIVIVSITAYFLLASDSGSAPVSPASTIDKPAKKAKSVPSAKSDPNPMRKSRSTPRIAKGTVPVVPAPIPEETIPVSNATVAVASAAAPAAPSNQIFNSASDQLLAMALGGEPGQDVPPLPLGPGVDHDFRESLKRPIVINDDDTEEVKRIKETVKAAREDMLKILEEGGTVEAALREHERLQRDNNKIHREAVLEYRRILESGDEEGAAEYMRIMNTAFQQMGIAPIGKRAGRRPRRGMQTEGGQK